MEVTVVVATYGAQEWIDLATARAVPSAEALDVPVVRVHGATLHEARNAGLAMVETEWVCHLDADDELEPKYFERMELGTADLRVPSVRYVKNGFDQGVRMPRVAGHAHTCIDLCLTEGNWLVVGTVARARLLRDVGGWHDYEWSEDWDLWLRCHLAGATIEAFPEAVYRAHVRRDSRNRSADRATIDRAYDQIRRANGLLTPA